MEWVQRLLFIVGLVLTVSLPLALGSSLTQALDATLYELTDESNYQVGCFDPCDCPIILFDTLQGSFLLHPISQDEDDAFFEVLQVDWQFVRDDETVHVTGSGLYQIDPELHRITLDLQIGDEEVQHFDSGMVPLQAEFPVISIAAAVNGFYCFDYAFFITAASASVNLDHDTWGCLKTRYR